MNVKVYTYIPGYLRTNPRADIEPSIIVVISILQRCVVSALNEYRLPVHTLRTIRHSTYCPMLFYSSWDEEFKWIRLNEKRCPSI